MHDAGYRAERLLGVMMMPLPLDFLTAFSKLLRAMQEVSMADNRSILLHR